MRLLMLQSVDYILIADCRSDVDTRSTICMASLNVMCRRGWCLRCMTFAELLRLNARPWNLRERDYSKLCGFWTLIYDKNFPYESPPQFHWCSRSRKRDGKTTAPEDGRSRCASQ